MSTLVSGVYTQIALKYSKHLILVHTLDIILSGGGNLIRYKIDVLEALKAVGYSSYRLRQDKIIGESMLQKIRRGEMMSWETLSKVCMLLNCQPGDILEYIQT